ncbi:hypothetical protein ATE80_08220 [Streptomyces kanasensis]|uniref:Uncharacterized protein n=1 Tax=Streptomyces kanasensis TaxID=936756 RepID=A0A117IWT5_9ACTN|nr:hypothetical protein ATE80_08220 [Streptomyces kanasensis]
MDLVLEVTERDELTDAALRRIGDDEYMPDEERAHAGTTVREDEAEALAYLVEPFQLVGEVPGVELVQASWSSEQTAYDPDVDAFLVDDEDFDFDDDGDGDADQGGPGEGRGDSRAGDGRIVDGRRG